VSDLSDALAWYSGMVRTTSARFRRRSGAYRERCDRSSKGRTPGAQAVIRRGIESQLRFTGRDCLTSGPTVRDPKGQFHRQRSHPAITRQHEPPTQSTESIASVRVIARQSSASGSAGPRLDYGGVQCQSGPHSDGALGAPRRAAPPAPGRSLQEWSALDLQNGHCHRRSRAVLISGRRAGQPLATPGNLGGG
jgi:hypothetical protein